MIFIKNIWFFFQCFLFTFAKNMRKCLSFQCTKNIGPKRKINYVVSMISHLVPSGQPHKKNMFTGPKNYKSKHFLSLKKFYVPRNFEILKKPKSKNLKKIRGDVRGNLVFLRGRKALKGEIWLWRGKGGPKLMHKTGDGKSVWLGSFHYKKDSLPAVVITIFGGVTILV